MTENVTENTLGERLRLIRGKMNQTDFSKTIGITVMTLSRYERDDRVPDAEMVRKICVQNGISPRWLILGEGPMYDAERDIKLNIHPGMKAKELRNHSFAEITGGPEFDTQAAMLEAKFRKFDEAFTASGEAEAMQARIKELEAQLEQARTSEQKAKEEALDAYKRLANNLEDKAKP